MRGAGVRAPGDGGPNSVAAPDNLSNPPENYAICGAHPAEIGSPVGPAFGRNGQN